VSISVHCASCGKDIEFDQPYPLHAGFSDQGFLYNDAGDLTFIWGSYDPVMKRLFPGKQPDCLSEQEQQAFEQLLKPAPSGGRWRFSNPARCPSCREPISPPMLKHIYYLRYPGSIDADDQKAGGLQVHVVHPDLTRRCS
jgi:hypothetical protein